MAVLSPSLFVLLSNVLHNLVFGIDIGAFDTGAKTYNDVEERWQPSMAVLIPRLFVLFSDILHNLVFWVLSNTRI